MLSGAVLGTVGVFNSNLASAPYTLVALSPAVTTSECPDIANVSGVEGEMGVRGKTASGRELLVYMYITPESGWGGDLVSLL